MQLDQQNDHEKEKAAPSNTKSSESTLKAFLQYSALPLALITALLSLIGWTYGTSYLAAWNLPERLFPLTREGIVFGGFYQLLLVVAQKLSFVAKLMLLLPVVMVATLITCYRPLMEWLNDRLINLFKPLRGRIEINKAHNGIMDTLLFVASSIGVSFVCVVGVTFLLIWTDGQAKEKVVKERKAILADGPGRPPSVRLYVRKESKEFDIHSGYIINVSATHAALYSKDKGMVILPVSSITRVEVAQGENEK